MTQKEREALPKQCSEGKKIIPSFTGDNIILHYCGRVGKHLNNKKIPRMGERGILQRRYSNNEIELELYIVSSICDIL